MLTTAQPSRRTLTSLIAVCVVATLFAALTTSARAKPRSGETAPEANTQAVGGPPEGRFRNEGARSAEVAQRRTRTSRTHVNEFGAFETDLFDTSIHYRGPEGNWKKINNDLVGSSSERYAYENAANRYRLLLPAALGNAPVRVNANGYSVSLRLDRATGTAQTSGSRASYSEALPGVDAVYFARSDSVKEDLVLRDAASTSTFRWTIGGSSNLTPKINPVGGVNFVTSSGRTMFWIPQPLIHDAADEVAPTHRFELVETNQQTQLRLTVDQRWLAQESRQFPVTVDPTLQVGPIDKITMRDCWINSGNTSGNYCGGNYVRVGFDGSSTKRSLMKFDLSEFPENATVLHAKLALNLAKETNDIAPMSVALKAATEGWNEYVTWNNRTASSAWSSAGGTFDRSKGYLLEGVDGTGTYNWHPTKLVQEWISGETDDRGFLVKTRFEDVNNVLFFSSGDNTLGAPQPTLTVTWDHGGIGEFDTYKLEEHQLTDRAHIHANVAGGNLVAHHTDLVIRGVGLDLKIDRYYNGLMKTNLLDTASNVGDGWTLSTAGDVGLKVYGDDSVAFFGPSGYRVAFHTESTTGDLQSPPGLKADVQHHSSGYTLTWRKSKEKMHFSHGGYIESHEDKNGNKLTFGYEGNKVVSITDTLGRVTRLGYDATSGQLRTITDPVNRVHRYDYDGQKLASYTNPENETYTYGYDANENLEVLTDPKGQLPGENGNQTRFTYDTTAGSSTEDWLKQIKYVIDDTTIPPTGNTLAFSYDQSIGGTNCDVSGSSDPALAGLDPVARTLVTDARENITKYCYNEINRVEIIFDAKNNRSTMKYNSEANVERFFDAMSREYGYGYDQTSGDLISSQSPGDSTSDVGETGEVSYGGDGHDHDGDGQTSDEHKHLPTKVIDARGYHTNFDYDANHNLTRVEQTPKQENIVFRYSYDTRGNITRVEAPEPEPDPLDASGNETQGNDTIFRYYESDAAADGDDGMLQVVDPPDAGGLGDTTFEYDALSRVVATTDGNGQRTAVTYDNVDRLKSITYADGRSVTYDYDAAGNMIQRTDRQGRTHSFTYDNKNQLDTQTRPDGSVVNYDYNRVGDLSRIDDRGRTTVYRYDTTNVMDRVTEPDGDMISLHPNAAYEYRRIDFPNRTSQRIERSKSGKIDKILGYDNNGTPANYDDDPAHFRKLDYDYTITLADGTKKDQGLIQKITDKQSRTSHFTYDSVGRLDQQKILNADGTVNREFAYDYDDNSNRTFAKAVEPTGKVTKTQFHYNDANQLACSYNTEAQTDRTDCGRDIKVTYKHDGNGNLTDVIQPDATKKTFRYDAADHMNRVDKANGASVDMDYQDATQEQRDAKTVNNALGVATEDVDYDHDLIGVSREKRTDAVGQETIHYIRTPDGRLLGQEKASGDEYYILDHLGSVRDVTSSSANVLQRYDYAPYGEVVWSKDPEFDNAWRFAQGYFDTNIGLNKLGVRYYGSDIARFTQLDPMAGKISDPVTLNRYQYANCNPANNVDPSGRSVADVLCSGTGERAIEYLSYAHLPNFGSGVTGFVTLVSAILSKMITGVFLGPVTLAVIGASLLATAIDLACDAWY